MAKTSKQSDTDGGERSPDTEGQRKDKGVDAKAREAEAHLRQAEAALRGQPEDRRDAARQTTPAGKGRSQ